MIRSSLLAVLLLVVGCGPLPLVSAKVQVPQICKTFTDVPMQGSPYAVSGTISTSVPLDFSAEMDAITGQGLTTEVKLLSVKVTPKTGVNDFGFLDAAKIDLATDSGATGVVSYARAPSAPAPAELDLAPTVKVDLAQLAPNGAVTVVITATGTLPTQPWSFDAEACFSANGAIEK